MKTQPQTAKDVDGKMDVTGKSFDELTLEQLNDMYLIALQQQYGLIAFTTNIITHISKKMNDEKSKSKIKSGPVSKVKPTRSNSGKKR